MTEPWPVHDLLLALAGRLDDDLLAWARELLAVGEHDQAVELATAALVAERVILPSSLRGGLVAAARAARTDLDVERALPPAGADDGTPHRFDGAAAPAEPVVAALRALPARRLAGCRVHLTWRRTPAGAVPGPLPRPVVLVEADPDRSSDVLAYLLATDLDRAGVRASVEVFPAGAALPAYHAAALHSAREVGGYAGEQAGSRPGEGGPTAAPVPAADPQPDAAGHDLAGAERTPGASEGRRRRPEPGVDFPPAPPSPSPTSLPITDPFDGPLRVPLLAPLLDPTGTSHPLTAASSPEPAGPEATPDVPPDVPEEWERDWRSGEWAMPRTDRPATPAERPPVDDAFGARPPRSGTAPGPPQRPERTVGSSGDGGAGPRQAPRPEQARDVSLFESPTSRVDPASGPPVPGRPDVPPLRAVPPPDRPGDDPRSGSRAPDVPLFGEGPGAGHRSGPPAPELPRPGRRRRPDDDASPAPSPEPNPSGPPPDSEPSALLSGTERDLLAQLHAELAEQERRPRPYRRGGQNGSHAVNGHGPDGDRPPDLAG